MSYRTHCDWCGEHLAYGDDQASMPVTIYHRGGAKSILDARWSEETKVTRHFCASSKDDTDRGGRNRMGLVPIASLDSCYDRAIAAMTGTELADPGMGMEWRLVPVDAARPAQAKVADKEPARWWLLPRERRDTHVLEIIGADGRMTITEVTEALRGRLGEQVVYSSNVRSVIMRLATEGTLDRVGETFLGKVRYRYFLRTDASVVA